MLVLCPGIALATTTSNIPSRSSYARFTVVSGALLDPCLRRDDDLGVGRRVYRHSCAGRNPGCLCCARVSRSRLRLRTYRPAVRTHGSQSFPGRFWIPAFAGMTIWVWGVVLPVIPAQAGIQCACDGRGYRARDLDSEPTNSQFARMVHSRFRGRFWIPAFAGMTIWLCGVALPVIPAQAGIQGACDGRGYRARDLGSEHSVLSNKRYSNRSKW